MSTKKTPPSHVISIGPVRATIWQSETEVGPRFTATFEKRYKDKSNEWQSSYSYSPSETLQLAEAARQVAVWVYAQPKPLLTVQERTPSPVLLPLP
jgi:hypothetical protein